MVFRDWASRLDKTPEPELMSHILRRLTSMDFTSFHRFARADWQEVYSAYVSPNGRRRKGRDGSVVLDWLRVVDGSQLLVLVQSASSSR